MKLRVNWDAMGITTSVACAVHCAILPLFVTALPLFGVNIIHNLAFEAGMVLLAFCIGAWSFYHGYRKHHHTLLPSLLFITGILLLCLKLFFIHYESWLLAPAVLFIIAAHYLNFRFCRVHNHAHGSASQCCHPSGNAIR